MRMRRCLSTGRAELAARAGLAELARDLLTPLAPLLLLTPLLVEQLF